jgi:hypothetical protein
MAVLANSLTTRANAKIISGISGTTYDATIDMLVNRVSGIIRRYLDRTLTRGTYTETLASITRQRLIVREWPIISVTTLTNKGYTYVLNTDYSLNDDDKAAGLIYKESGWEPINLVSGLTLDVQAAAREIIITYIAGYYMPADSHYVEGASDSLPIEIQQIVDEIVAERFLRIKTKSAGLTSYNEGGISYNWRGNRDTEEIGISDEHALTLNSYKRSLII